MERRKHVRGDIEASRKIHLGVNSILQESINERDDRIRALEDEIRSLRGLVSCFQRDPRFWIGFPIGLTDDPSERPATTGISEKDSGK